MKVFNFGLIQFRSYFILGELSEFQNFFGKEEFTPISWKKSRNSQKFPNKLQYPTFWALCCLLLQKQIGFLLTLQCFHFLKVFHYSLLLISCLFIFLVFKTCLLFFLFGLFCPSLTFLVHFCEVLFNFT